MSAVKIMILLCQFIFFLATFTFQLSILIPFLFIWSPPDEYKRPVILYCDQSCNVWRSFHNKAKYYNDSSHLWQGRSLMSFLQSTYFKLQQDLHYSTTWCGSQFKWRNTSQLFNYPSFPFLHPGPREVELHPGQHLLRCEEHTRLSWSYPGWWWWSSFEETSPWINGVRQNQESVDYRRLHQGLVTTTWHSLRFRTSGGGAYSPSSNLVVSSVQSCRGCRRNFQMPLTKSTRMSSVKS